jgi:transmembrane sensor
LEQALDWIVRLKTGEPTRADVEALQCWRAQGAAHEEAFKEAARIFRHAGIAARELADQPAATHIRAIAPWSNGKPRKPASRRKSPRP